MANRNITAVVRLLIALCIPFLTLGFTTTSSYSASSSRASSISVQLFAKSTNNHHDDDDEPTLNRRAAIQQTAVNGLAFSTLLLSSSATSLPAYAAESYDDTIKKRILITGCNSGIGLDAAQRMAMRGHEIVLACVSMYLVCFFICFRIAAKGILTLYTSHTHNIQNTTMVIYREH